MNRYLTLTLMSLAALAFANPVHANLLLDGFGDEQPIDGKVADNTVGDGPESHGPAPISDTDFTGVERTLTAELTLDGGGSAEVAANVVDGVYEHTQTSGEDGYTRIDWTFDASSLNDPVNIFTNVSFIDQDADLLFTLEDAGGTSETKTSSVTSTGTATHEFGGFDGLDMANITGAGLEIRGNTSLDMNLQFVEVPAPGVLGLFGLGAAGLAFFAGRGRREAI